MKDFFDYYTFNARLKPALLVIFPLAGAISSLGLNFSASMAIISGPISAAGGTLLLAQFGRDFGSKQQPHLYQMWGGKPSTAMLRHGDGRLNVHTLSRYHAAAAACLGQIVPNAEQEVENPRAADALYEAYGDLLREHTRDKRAFPLVFKELVNYGFRRNLWGMKPLGVTIASISIAIQLVITILGLLGKIERPGAPDMIFLIVDVFIFGCWLFFITPNWVRIAADAYAARLLAASEDLNQELDKKQVKF